MAKLTKEREALLLMNAMGQIPNATNGYDTTLEDLARRWLARQVGATGAYSITPAGRSALTKEKQDE